MMMANHSEIIDLVRILLIITIVSIVEGEAMISQHLEENLIVSEIITIVLVKINSEEEKTLMIEIIIITLVDQEGMITLEVIEIISMIEIMVLKVLTEMNDLTEMIEEEIEITLVVHLVFNQTMILTGKILKDHLDRNLILTIEEMIDLKEEIIITDLVTMDFKTINLREEILTVTSTVKEDLKENQEQNLLEI